MLVSSCLIFSIVSFIAGWALGDKLEYYAKRIHTLDTRRLIRFCEFITWSDRKSWTVNVSVEERNRPSDQR